MKKLNKKAYFLIPALAVALLTGTAVSAHGMGGGGGFMMKGDPQVTATKWEERITQDAGLLGISVDEMKAKWAEGKGLREIAQEKGISDTDLQAKLKAAREAEQKTWLQTLVSQGKITQAQADARLKFMSEHEATRPQMMKRMKGQNQQQTPKTVTQ